MIRIWPQSSDFLSKFNCCSMMQLNKIFWRRNLCSRRGCQRLRLNGHYSMLMIWGESCLSIITANSKLRNLVCMLKPMLQSLCSRFLSLCIIASTRVNQRKKLMIRVIQFAIFIAPFKFACEKFQAASAIPIIKEFRIVIVICSSTW